MRLTDEGRPLVHSFAGDRFDVCADYLGMTRMVGRRPDRAAYRREAGQRSGTRPNGEQRAQFCAALWAGSAPVEGSPGALYLARRGIDWFPADMRFHPRAPRGYRSTATSAAALVLARSVAGRAAAIQATYLGPDCRSKIGRATFGLLAGAAVRLCPFRSELAVAEGVETALSFAALHGVPTWATLGTGNLIAFQPPPGVRRLIIAADGDVPGLRAARALTDRLRRMCVVEIAAAPEGADWNDVATGGNSG